MTTEHADRSAAARERVRARYAVAAGQVAAGETPSCSCKELRDLIGSGFQGCMRIPAGPVGGEEKCSEGGRSIVIVRASSV